MNLKNCKTAIIILITGMFTFSILGCAAHPVISPEPLKKGETSTAVALSMENLIPVYVIRKGISDISDVGFRIGIPLYGSGIDYSRVMFERGNIRDILNLGFTLSPNSHIDLTYYTVRNFQWLPGKSVYTGFRGMFIPSGITGKKSIRAGFLAGFAIKNKWGIEAGYFHDFVRGQPAEKILVTHGTDTLVDTACRLMGIKNKTIVWA